MKTITNDTVHLFQTVFTGRGKKSQYDRKIYA